MIWKIQLARHLVGRLPVSQAVSYALYRPLSFCLQGQQASKPRGRAVSQMCQSWGSKQSTNFWTGDAELKDSAFSDPTLQLMTLWEGEDGKSVGLYDLAQSSQSSG
jgi:hypothetical protein